MAASVLNNPQRSLNNSFSTLKNRGRGRVSEPQQISDSITLSTLGIIHSQMCVKRYITSYFLNYIKIISIDIWFFLFIKFKTPRVLKMNGIIQTEIILTKFSNHSSSGVKNDPRRISSYTDTFISNLRGTKRKVHLNN